MGADSMAFPLLVRPNWVSTALQRGQPLRVLDCTWYLPNTPFAAPEGASAASNFQERRIPTARFLDLDGIGDPEIAPTSPHNLPNSEVFKSTMAELGITKETPVVVYDALGMFSAPRGWHTLRAYGHEQVAVLQGGLPA